MGEKNKILMVGPAPPQIGGMETLVGGLLNSDLMKQYDVSLLNISKPGINARTQGKEFVGYDSFTKRNVFITLRSYAYSVSFFFRYVFVLVLKRPQLVHIHTASYFSFWEKGGYIILTKVLGKKIVLHSHGGMFADFYEKSSSANKRWIVRLLQACDRVVVLSESWKTFFMRLIPEQNIRVIPNGIDLSQFDIQEKKRSDDPVFLYMAKVSEKKGIYDLIRAARLLLDRGLNCRFLVAGSGEIEQAKRMAKKLQVDGAVQFLGLKTGREKAALFATAWCFVLPSYFEGFPISILEAYAAGLPVISTRVGAIPSILKQDENGCLFAPGNVEELADCIFRIATDSDWRKAMSETNAELARKEFSIELCSEKMGRVYAELL